MNSSMQKTLIEKLEFGDTIRVYLNSGDILTLPYEYTRRIEASNPEDLKEYRLIGGGIGIHFPRIDEDISLNGILRYKWSHELQAS